MSHEAIALEDVWVRYGDNTVLQEVTLTVCEGDFLGVIGPNGGGKTTLLKVIMGMIQPLRVPLGCSVKSLANHGVA